MKEFQIGPNEAGQRLDKYLHKLLPAAGSGFLYKMLRKKNIVLDGRKAEGSARLKEGSTVTVYFSDETFETFGFGKFDAEKFHADKTFSIDSGNITDKNPLQVLYEDKDMLAVYKPAGMLSQKASARDVSANEYIIQYLLDTGALTQQALRTFRPSVCSRLDRNTSGILLAGKTLKGLQEISGQLKQQQIEKYYTCIVSGIVDRPQHLKAFISKDHDKNKVRIIHPKKQPPAPGSQYIETAYKPLRRAGRCTVLEVRLITGRSHQIRAHLASIGHPVIGDPKYGDAAGSQKLRTEIGLRRQLLHAGRVVLSDGREITAPLPPDFARAEAYLSAEC